MSFIWLNVFMFCIIDWIWFQVSADGEILQKNISVTWNESRTFCEGMGKALFDVMVDNPEAILKNLLNDRDQSWVAATVELSPFINQPDCMQLPFSGFNQKKTFTTNIIWNCLQFCKQFTYIGLKGNECFCFIQGGDLNRSSGCNHTCNNDPSHLCGGNNAISLYAKAGTTITKKIANGPKECVYARKTSSGTGLFTASCLGEMEDGAVCERADDLACRNHGWTVAPDKICQMDLHVPFRWKQANAMCASIGGQLMTSTITSLPMKENLTYWLGFHRIAAIHRSKDVQPNNNDTYCAVVRKEGDNVTIEGEDCLAKKAFLCHDKEIPQSTSSYGTDITQKSNPRNISTKEQTDGLIIYVVVSVSAVLFLAFTAFAWFFSYKRRRQQSPYTEVRTTNSLSEQHALLQSQVSNPPAKPSRKAQSNKEYAVAMYKNVVAVGIEQTVTVDQLGLSRSGEEDYDRIDLDNEHIQEKVNKDDDLHLYDHTCLRMSDDQYDLTVLTGVKAPILDETYDKMTLSQHLDTDAMQEEEATADSK